MSCIVASKRIDSTCSLNIITFTGAWVIIICCFLSGRLGHNFSFGYIAVRSKQYRVITLSNRGGLFQHEWSRLTLSDRIAGLVLVPINEINENMSIIFIVIIRLLLSLFLCFCCIYSTSIVTIKYASVAQTSNGMRGSLVIGFVDSSSYRVFQIRDVELPNCNLIDGFVCWWFPPVKSLGSSLAHLQA